jgi:hypothetical protein
LFFASPRSCSPEYWISRSPVAWQPGPVVGAETPSPSPGGLPPAPKRWRRALPGSPGAVPRYRPFLPGPTRFREHRGAPFPSPGRLADPPRCLCCPSAFDHLPSPSSGFRAPPSPFRSFDLDPGVFGRVASPSSFPSGSLPLLNLHAPSRISTASSSALVPRLANPWFRRRPFSPELSRPSGAPSAKNPLPAAPSVRTCARPSSAAFAAGFHTRCVPPASFLATLTVCSSSHPVISFNHSHPWGCFSPSDPVAVTSRGAEAPRSVPPGVTTRSPYRGSSCASSVGLTWTSRLRRSSVVPPLPPGRRLACSTEVLPTRRPPFRPPRRRPRRSAAALATAGGDAPRFCGRSCVASWTASGPRARHRPGDCAAPFAA